MYDYYQIADLKTAAASVHPARTHFPHMLEYQRPALVNKLQADLGLTPAEAEILFTDVKRFIALAATTTRPLTPTVALDRAWHAFILDTRAYAEFCKAYCGRFVHHTPDDPFGPARDRSTVTQTLVLARSVFGTLSTNWECTESAECTRCANCQSPCQAPCGSDGDG